MSKPTKSIGLCAGCRDDFYNGKNPYDVKQCWGFPESTVVKRLMIPVDLRPPYNQKSARWVLSCYHPDRTCNVKPEAIGSDGFWKH